MRLALLLMLPLVACSPARGGGGGGGDDDDFNTPPTGFVLEVDGEDVPPMEAIYIDEDMPWAGRQRMVMASEQMSCARYQEYWSAAVPIYEEWLLTGDSSTLTEDVGEALRELPGMPGWWAQLTLFTGPVEGESIDAKGVGFTAQEYQDGEPEDPTYGPFAIGPQVTIAADVSGEFTAGGDSPAGSMTFLANWNGDFDPNGPSTSAERDATLSFEAELCDIEDVEEPEG